MNSTLFKKVINEELIEVNKSVPETIQCLREQFGGALHTVAKNDVRIFFDCTKKGKLLVRSNFDGYNGDYRGLYLYYVNGNVISKDNKTYVKITSVYRKTDIWLLVFQFILSILIMPILLILKTDFKEALFVPAAIVSLVVFIIAQISTIKIKYIRKKRGLEIVKLMEDEIKKRVQNIARWDD